MISATSALKTGLGAVIEKSALWLMPPNAFRGDQFLTTVTVNTTSLSGVGQKAFGGISHSAEFSITAPKPVFKAEVALIKASTLPKGVTFTRVKVNN